MLIFRVTVFLCVRRVCVCVCVVAAHDTAVELSAAHLPSKASHQLCCQLICNLI